jgi:YbbR domain-containing protein
MKQFLKIKNRIKQLIKNNKFLAVLSVLIAFGLWLFVSLTVNTEGYAVIRNVPIEFSSGNSESGLSVITKSVSSVDVVVYGSRSIVGVLAKTDFEARANYSNITAAGSYNLSLSVSPREATPDYKISSVSVSSVDVLLDRIVSKKFEITPELVGATVSDGFVLQTPALSKTEITLTGAETEINKVSSAVAKVNINSEITETKTHSVSVEFRNNDGGVVNLQNVSTDANTVDVTVSVLKEKEVGVKFSYTNIPAGFDINTLSYSLSHKTIKIAGPTAVVDDLTEINIGYIDITELTLNGHSEIAVSLPSGIVNLEGIETIIVNFNFDDFIQKIFWTQNINVVGASSKYDITVLTKTITRISVLGKQSLLTKLTSDDIVAEVDIASLGEITVGTQAVPVKITITSSSEVFATGDYTANISVREK